MAASRQFLNTEYPCSLRLSGSTGKKYLIAAIRYFLR